MATPGRKKRGREPGDLDLLTRRRKAVPEHQDVQFIYRPDDNSIFDHLCPGQVVNVLVHAKHLFQPCISTAKLYGGSGPSDYYHPESDIVVAAMHAGKFHPSKLPADLYAACIELVVHPGQQRYCPKERYGVRSKPCYTATEVSFQPTQVKLLFETNRPNRHKQRPRRLPADGCERMAMFDVTSRLHQVYHIRDVRDKGFEEKDFTSTRFLSECLYLGVGSDLYELALTWKQEGAERVPSWQWSKLNARALENLILSVVMADRLPRLLVPLEGPYKDVVHGDLRWDELVWEREGVSIRGEKFVLTTMEWKKLGDSLGDNDSSLEQDLLPDADLEEEKLDDQG
eukprot:GGOE01014382.1.p1 GENE.GGOE01014382.1~~GGOE01014382.1.p1  ORF type:complete len:342 (-),score=59.84 GGOE01014382.1:179-1204(-)